MYTIKSYRYTLDTDDDSVLDSSRPLLTEVYYETVKYEDLKVDSLEELFKYIKRFYSNNYGYIFIPELKMEFNNKKLFINTLLQLGIKLESKFIKKLLGVL